MAKVIEDPRPTAKERLNKTVDGVQGSQAWNSIFRPGSIFRKGYTDSPRNRSYVIMNSVLYHLHPVKVKRHAVKVSYTLCLGGLSFFLFILLTVKGIIGGLASVRAMSYAFFTKGRPYVDCSTSVDFLVPRFCHQIHM